MEFRCSCWCIVESVVNECDVETMKSLALALAQGGVWVLMHISYHVHADVVASAAGEVGHGWWSSRGVTRAYGMNTNGMDVNA